MHCRWTRRSCSRSRWREGWKLQAAGKRARRREGRCGARRRARMRLRAREGSEQQQGVSVERTAREHARAASKWMRVTARTHRCCRALRQPAAGSGVLPEIQKGLLPCSKAGSRGSSPSLRQSRSMRAEAGQLGRPTAQRLGRGGGARARVRFGRPAWLGRGGDCVQIDVGM